MNCPKCGKLVSDDRDHCPNCFTQFVEYCVTSPSVVSEPGDPVRQKFVAFKHGSGVIDESINGFATDSLSLPSESDKNHRSNQGAVACLDGFLSKLRDQGWEVDEANLDGLWFRYRLRRLIQY
jgi:hypothetical protein